MTASADAASVRGVRRIALGWARRGVKAAASPILGVGRPVGAFGLPRGAIHADAVSRSDRLLRVTPVDLSESRRVLKTLGAGDTAPATSPVRASVTMLDGSQEALVFSNNHVVDHQRRIVYERAVDFHERPFAFDDLHVWRERLERPREVGGSVAYLSNTGIQNYGHWLLLVLPLVQHYREHLGGDPDYFYIGRPAQEWHYESLEALGIGRDRVLTDAVVGDRMLAAVADNATPFPTSFIDFTAGALGAPWVPPRERQRIFVSRALRRERRPFMNEDECASVLTRHGFRFVHPETLSFDEETKLFASAEIVVGLHGAGLANLLFCPTPSVAVELFPYGFSNPWFAELCAVRGLTYGCLYGERTSGAGLQPTQLPVVIDPLKLDRVLVAAAQAAESALDAAVGSPTGNRE